MTLKELLGLLYQNPDQLQFDDVLSAIDSEFDYTPSAFSNGGLNSKRGENEGSCKVLAFANQARLSEPHTLALFAEHYRSVLADPEGSAHQNIRQFIVNGWKGVSFERKALIKK